MSQHGVFAWFELVTTDVPAGVAFWSEVAGLKSSSMDMGSAPYQMLAGAGAPFAGVVPPAMPNTPSMWLAYWGVDDVDARTARVKAAGGTVHVPPTDLPGTGRFSIVADPQGAVVALFRGTDDSAGATDIAWMELWAKDGPAAVAFYASVLDLKTQKTQMPAGEYHLLLAGEKQVAGAMTSPNDKAPPMWLPYLAVSDVDEAMTRVRNHGGAVHLEPMAVPGIGKFGVVADRQHAVLGLLTPGR